MKTTTRFFALVFFLFLVPLSTSLCGRSLQSQMVVLQFAPLPEEVVDLLAGEATIQAALTTSRPEGLKSEPSSYPGFVSYGVLPLGDGSGGPFIFAVAGRNLYPDRNQNGDLGEEEPLAAVKLPSGLYRPTLLIFPVVTIKIPYRDAFPQEYRLLVTCDLEAGLFTVQNLGWRVGRIVRYPPDKDLSVALYDASPPNGRFGDYGADLIFFDRNGDGRFDAGPKSTEQFRLQPTITFDDIVFSLEASVPGDYLYIGQKDTKHQPEGRATIRYRTERDGKVLIQKGEATVVFSAGTGFQLLLETGPAAFRRGGKSEVVVDEGRLVLYDFYNFIWDAYFTGTGQSAGLVDSFPARIDFGPPFELQIKVGSDKGYRRGDTVEITSALLGRAQEAYTRFRRGSQRSGARPAGTKITEVVYEDKLPQVKVSTAAGVVLAEGPMEAVSGGFWRYRYLIPRDLFVPPEGVTLTVTVTWDTGPFQAIVRNEALFFVKP